MQVTNTISPKGNTSNKSVEKVLSTKLFSSSMPSVQDIDKTARDVGHRLNIADEQYTDLHHNIFLSTHYSFSPSIKKHAEAIQDAMWEEEKAAHLPYDERKKQIEKKYKGANPNTNKEYRSEKQLNYINYTLACAIATEKAVEEFKKLTGLKARYEK
jgi:hypothetical protein